MIIQLPKDVESSINAAVHGGHFASVDEAMTEAARLLLRNLDPGQAGDDPPVAPRVPIWEEIAEITAGVPDEVWETLPTDLSAQHDHYLYGTPKCPDA